MGLVEPCYKPLSDPIASNHTKLLELLVCPLKGHTQSYAFEDRHGITVEVLSTL